MGRDREAVESESAPSSRQSGTLARPTKIAGRYFVAGTLGRGGMGEVLEVRDETTGRALALKRLHIRNERSRRDRRTAELRFRREFHTMSSLAHPRIVSVFDFGYEDGQPWYTMELLDGQDLRDVGTTSWRDACKIIREVAAALGFLHQRGLVHRDISPRNVRLGSDGHAKLIDFGVLGTVGTVGTVAGTPPFIPPESLRGMPLDHRADLYGLGALTYRLLTGNHAYPARRLEDLEAAWRERPAPLDSDCPEALSELVLSLLSLDPMARPATATEVIDRLGAIADLPAMDGIETARGYVASVAMVGRKKELGRIRRRLEQAVDGRGRGVIIEAPSGIGKSRLLREAGLEAKLLGATTASARAGSTETQGPFGVLRGLARELLDGAKEDTIRAAESVVGIVARVLPEMRAALGPVAISAPLGDPSEERLRVQQALTEWFLRLAKRRPIALLVDDVQRCDEGSAAVLGTLARESASLPLVVLTALRTDEAPRSASAMGSIRDSSTRVPLRGLSAEDVETMTRTAFGDAPHVKRLAHWLSEVAGGSPLHVTELLRHVVDREIVTYADGMWSIPAELGELGVPAGLADAMDARIDGLSPEARALGQVLAVHGGELPLSLCTSLAADDTDEATVFSALDELCFQQVLIRSGERYRFRHDGLREALLRLPTPEDRAALHRHVGRTILAMGELSSDREAEVGWHLHAGGVRGEAAELLERAGMRLYEVQGFADALPCLETALEELEAAGHPPSRTMPLRRALLSLATFVDPELAYRYLDDTVTVLRRDSGLDLCARLRPFIGPILGLLVGIAWAGTRRLFTPGSRRGPSPIDALTHLFTAVTFASAVFSASFDLKKTDEVLQHVDVFSAFRGTLPYAAWLLCRAFLYLPHGHNRPVFRDMTRVLEITGRRIQIPPIREVDIRSARGAAHYTRAFLKARELDPDCLAAMEALQEIDMRFFEVGAEVSRSVYHRIRGEETLARAVDDRVELAFIQLGHMWLLEAQHAWSRALAYAFARDVLGLRRSLVQLGALHERGVMPAFLLELTRGEYYRERGDYDRAREALEKALAAMHPEDLQYRPPAEAALAETLLAARDFEGARRAAERGLSVAAHPDAMRPLETLRLERALALADAADGALDDATRRLDDVISRAEVLEAPTLAGGAHEARARVALMAEDMIAAEFHTSQCERFFKSTDNAGLIARVERLIDAKEAFRASTPPSRANLSSEAVTEVTATSGSQKWVSAQLSHCSGPAERAQRALEILLHEAGADGGRLFLCTDDGVECVAPLGTRPAPEESEAVVRALSEHTVDDEDPTVVEGVSSAADHDRDLAIDVMSIRRGGRWIPIGAIVTDSAESRLAAAAPAVLELVGESLYRAGDAVSFYRSLSGLDPDAEPA